MAWNIWRFVHRDTLQTIEKWLTGKPSVWDTSLTLEIHSHMLHGNRYCVTACCKKQTLDQKCAAVQRSANDSPSTLTHRYIYYCRFREDPNFSPNFHIKIASAASASALPKNQERQNPLKAGSQDVPRHLCITEIQTNSRSGVLTCWRWRSATSPPTLLLS